jgi:hypothetical protein
VVVDPNAPLHLYLGSSEVETTGYIKLFAREGLRCFDVGGHDACDAMVLARLTGTTVTSFEFDETSITRMERNLALNSQLARDVQIVHTYVAHERVPSLRTDTLDGLIAERTVALPDFVKIDVEGAEAAVLTGASELLRTRRPHLIVETHSADLEVQCVALLKEAGYSPAIVDQRRWLRERRGSEQNRWIVAPGRER